MRWVKDHRKVVLTGLLVILVMTMIFCFSSQQVKASDGLSRSIASMIVTVYSKLKLLLGVDSSDTPWLPTGYSFLEDINHYVRKLAHLLEFMLLGGVLTLHHIVALQDKDIRLRWYKISISLLIGILYAASDELHQLFVDGRGARIKDVLIDSMGVLLGCVLVFVIYNIVQRRKGKGGSRQKTKDGSGSKS